MPTDPSIHYTVRLQDPAAHLLEVELDVRGLNETAQIFSLPAWIPGSYLIRDFARHIVSIEADDGQRKIPIAKLDKHSWSAKPRSGRLRLRYRVYAWDLSVRGAHFDDTHAFFNGTSVFLAVCGYEHLPCAVHLAPPAQQALAAWRVATSLERAGADLWAFGDYLAADYDTLIDHPVEIGAFQTASFNAGGTRHEIVVTGRHDGDLARFARDLKAICATQQRLFEPGRGRAPVSRYLFLLTLVGDGYGGLEHRASTALIAQRDDMPRRGLKQADDAYVRLLGLASHEYFHTWHVKRIKPAAFSPYRLERESHTELLWVFEGFTSYYDDLMLRRAQRIDTNAYLGLVGETLSRVLAGPGRLAQSIAASSFDAWTKFYRQDENAVNAIVSYYAKGALVALALDLSMRERSRGQRSLDDVMRLMWSEFGRDFDAHRTGVDEDAMPAIIRRACGLDMSREIRRWVHGTTELPLQRLLASHGVDLKLIASAEDIPWIGARSIEVPGALKISAVVHNSPAHDCGLSAGDQLIAIDGMRVCTSASLTKLLRRRRAGDLLRLHAFRADELREYELMLAAPQKTTARLTLAPRPGAGARRLRKDWLGPESESRTAARTTV